MKLLPQIIGTNSTPADWYTPAAPLSGVLAQLYHQRIPAAGDASDCRSAAE
jgi:hypothetical protein